MKRALVLLALSAQLFAAEVPIAEPQIVPGDDFFSRAWPDVAAGDAGFLVAWEERTFGSYPGIASFRTYDRDGVPHRPDAFRLGSGYNRSPHVVWTGSEYLVVYARWLSRFGSPPIPALFAARITADGVMVEDSEVVIAEAQNTGLVEEVVWTGSEAIVLATIENAPWLLHLSAHGTLTQRTQMLERPADIAAGGGAGFFLLPQSEGDAAAANAEKIAIVDNTGAGVVVSFHSFNRTLLDGFVLAPQGKHADSIAWDGSAWVTAYIEAGAVCTARFTSASDVVRSCNGETNAAMPVIDAYNRRTLTAWLVGKQILTDRGMASEMIAVQRTADATVDPSGLLVVWNENDRIRTGGPGRPTQQISTPAKAYSPRIATAGSQSLLVWVEPTMIRAMRLDAQGNPIPPAVDLGTGDWPSLATDGTNWIVAWRNGNEVVSTLVTPNLDSNGLQHYGAAETWQDRPVAAATPSGFLVVWNETQSELEGTHDRIVAEPLDANGQRISGGVRIVDRIDGTRADATTLAVRCVSERCLVAWDETAPGRAELVSMIVGPDAKPLTSPRVLRGVLTGGRKAILPFEGGGFRLYSGGALIILDADGRQLDTQRWTDKNIDLGAAAIFRGRLTLVYSRDFRVFVRDFGARTRAVRH
ncbi:MAG TPA: hypothetical protein VNA69_16025 [Thermoanaerobaculia bacterium]|nr:hypothetical protein [Thermoanaerobaculia bacterium]